MRNKALISFISLTLISEIHRVMKEKDLYKKMTAGKLLLRLAKLNYRPGGSPANRRNRFVGSHTTNRR
jgi:hypothetical protein